MGIIKQINIKYRTYYFSMTLSISKILSQRLLKIDKKHYKGINIYYIGCIAIKNIWWLWKYLQCESFVFTY